MTRRSPLNFHSRKIQLLSAGIWLSCVGLLSVAGCGSEDGSSAPECYLTEVPASPSFREHILPSIQSSCLGNSCHGSPQRSEADLYLGKRASNPMTRLEISDIVARLVDQPSQTAPEVMLVAPGDAANSFLMHKLDNTHRAQGFVCQGGGEHPCGDSMPESGEILCENDRNAVRAWINQGAQDN